MALVGIFGTLPFTCAEGFVLTFRDFKRSMSERWAKHAVIGSEPVAEWCGTETQEIDLTISLNAGLGVPPQAGMLMLRSMLESHEAQRLVIGPEYFGRFVLESISESRKHFSGLGVCLLDDIELKLFSVSGGWA